MLRLLPLLFLLAPLAHAHATEYNLYIEYCPTKHPSSCIRLFDPRAELLLGTKGFKVVDNITTPQLIVIQLHDGCSFLEICAPNEYAEEAIIRLQDTGTFQIHYEQLVRRHVFPRTSKVLMEEAIMLFNP